MSYGELEEFDDRYQDDIDEVVEPEPVGDNLPEADSGYEDYGYGVYDDDESEFVGDGDDEIVEADNTCAECDGTGEFPKDHLCKACNGKGYIGE